jgi:hypothetical protein
VDAVTRAGGAALASALAATGCLSVPPYEPPASTLSYHDDDGGGASISGEHFVIHFSGGPGFHFPSFLGIDGADTLGHDLTAPCYGEDNVGVVLFPTPRIAANTSAAVTTGGHAPTLRGPAVVQVRVDWSSQFTCSNNHPGGSSLYTAFPDGRIVRHDAIDDQNTSDISSLACACDAKHNQGFQVASYWTFSPSRFLTITVPGSTSGAIPLPRDPMMPFQSPNFYVGCLDGDDYQLGVGWSMSDRIAGTPRIFASPTQVVFSRERTGGFVSTLDPLTWETNDALFIEHAGCKKALDRATEHAMPSNLDINGDPTAVSLVDGIYGGDAGQSGKPGVTVPPGRVELTGPVGSSFAVWLRFTSPVDAIRPQLAGRTGAWYVLQRIDAREWIAWFRDPLTAGETIAIETLP